MTRRVLQETPYGCYGAVAAMITGQTFQQMATEIGHDGSDYHYTDLEIFCYLASHGFIPDAGLIFGYDHDAPVTHIGNIATGDHWENLLIPATIAKKLRDHAEEYQTTVSDVITNMVRRPTSADQPPPVSVPRNAACPRGLHGKIFMDAGLAPIRTPVYLDRPAILTVLNTREGNHGHAVYWDGTKTIDPSPNTPESWQLEDYVVHCWMPIRNISYQRR